MASDVGGKLVDLFLGRLVQETVDGDRHTLEGGRQVLPDSDSGEDGSFGG